jgi:3-deoxy-D-manno-octulosonic-acid transferase
VGEIHLLPEVVARFRRRYPTWQCVISTTTDTGFEEARKRFPDLTIFYWPLDFSWAVHRALARVKPDLVVLAEGELWPNFLAAAKRREIAIAVINGRMSPRSFRRYKRFRLLSGDLWKWIDLYAVQTEEYADSLRALGAPAERIHVTNSVKYDGIPTDRRNPRTLVLRRLLTVEPGDLIWIAGSTQAPEEETALTIFERLRPQFSNLRFILVPRQKDRFDAVANLIQSRGQPFVCRSQLGQPLIDREAVILVDTIGELGSLWGLADVAFVGGSLDGRRGGQNMIEPAAYGAAVIFGPHVWNFRDTAARLVSAGAAIQVADAADLETTVRRLLADHQCRRQLGVAAQQLVEQQQGATDRTVELLGRLVARATTGRQAA